MKQLIVTIAVVPMLFIFILQFSHAQINHNKLITLERVVDAAEEQAKLNGKFTEDIVSDLKDRVAGILNVTPDEISFSADTSIKYRGEQITYELIVPFKDVMAGNKMLGIKDEANVATIDIKRTVTSEKLKP